MSMDYRPTKGVRHDGKGKADGETDDAYSDSKGRKARKAIRFCPISHFEVIRATDLRPLGEKEKAYKRRGEGESG